MRYNAIQPVKLHRKRTDGEGKEKGRIGADGKRSSRTEGRRLKTEGGRLESRSIIDSNEADGGITKDNNQQRNSTINPEQKIRKRSSKTIWPAGRRGAKIQAKTNPNSWRNLK